MQAIFNFIPTYCPKCGMKLFTGATETARAILADYMEGNEFTCNCGLQFRKDTNIYRTLDLPKSGRSVRCKKCGELLIEQTVHCDVCGAFT